MMSPHVKLSDTIAGERARNLGRLCVLKEDSRATLPLVEVRISARVAGRVAEVSLTQKFRNPFTESLEAVYIFPLGGGAAVSAFEMLVGGRAIHGVCKERGKAREEYQQAIRDGRRASLLEQDRDDVFTCQVGNLPPGEEVTVKIVHSERLAFFEDGTTELRLPLVVAPRYIPGQPLPRDPVGDGTEWDTDQVGDASRITPPRLAPGVDPRVALGIEVEMAGGAPADLACSQHATRLKDGKIALSRGDELLDRDFVLRWRLAGETLEASLLVHRDGTGMLSLLPPRRDGAPGSARDVIFVLDHSGSMGGAKMASAARACSVLLSTLGPRDRFAIVAFDTEVEWFGERKLTAADEAGIAAGDRFLRGIEARGGTELAPALADTLALIQERVPDENRLPVVVILTDGQVGNESDCLKRIQKEGQGVRFFTVGIDTAVNQAFLERVARLGRGTSTCVVPGEALEEALQRVGRDIGAPLVVDLEIEGAEDVAPSRLPDLFAGRAATVFLRPKGNRVRVRGSLAGGGLFDETVEVRETELPAITHLWARARIADLEDRFRLEPGKHEAISKEIIELSVRHTVLTRFTAFVVVDEKEVVGGGTNRRVVQPVHVPARWEAPGSVCAGLSTNSFALRGESHESGRNETSLPCVHDPFEERGVSAKEVFRKIFGKRERRLLEDTFRKAIETLKDALASARRDVEAGKLPEARPIEKTTEAFGKVVSRMQDEVGRRVLEVLLGQLMRLVKAIRARGATAASVKPPLEQCIRDLEKLLEEKGFWAHSI